MPRAPRRSPTTAAGSTPDLDSPGHPQLPGNHNREVKPFLSPSPLFWTIPGRVVDPRRIAPRRGCIRAEPDPGTTAGSRCEERRDSPAQRLASSPRARQNRISRRLSRAGTGVDDRAIKSGPKRSPLSKVDHAEIQPGQPADRRHDPARGRCPAARAVLRHGGDLPALPLPPRPARRDRHRRRRSTSSSARRSPSASNCPTAARGAISTASSAASARAHASRRWARRSSPATRPRWCRSSGS